MKRLLYLASLLIAPFFATCDKGETTPEDPDATTGASIPSHEEENGNTAGDGKTLIVFFSRTGENWRVGVVEKGNTAIMAEYIQEYTKADVFEIVPEVAYPEGYEDCKTVATSEKNSNARPKFKGSIENLSQYENVFIGSPIWWGEPPMIMHTFYEAYPELKEKTIIPFGTHGGSGVGSCLTTLKKYYPDAKYLESLGISGSEIRKESSKTAVQNWLKKIGFTES